MCRNVRISMTAGLAAAFVLAVCPLAAQAKTPTGHASTSHSSGNNTNKGAKSNGTMHTAPYTKVSHDSSKSMHDYKHKDTQYSHCDHDSHDHYCKDHDHYCKDHDRCKDHDHYCKDHCHDHDYCHDHCHDWCHDRCWPCGFCWDFPCVDFGCDVGCDFGCEIPCGDCQPVCQPACSGPVIIINNNDNPCESDDNVVIDQ